MIKSAKQANDEFEKSRQKRFDDFLEKIQTKIDEAIKDNKEYFYKKIPKWCQEDVIKYLKQMGYEVIKDDEETNEYIIVFGESLKKEIAEKRRKRQIKKRRRKYKFFAFLTLVLIASYCIVIIWGTKMLSFIGFMILILVMLVASE